MDSSVSPKDEIWFLRVCHHISNAVYLRLSSLKSYYRYKETLPYPQTNKTNTSTNQTSWKQVYVNLNLKESLIHRFSNSKPRYAGVLRDFVKQAARLWMKEWYACMKLNKEVKISFLTTVRTARTECSLSQCPSLGHRKTACLKRFPPAVKVIWTASVV